MVKVTRSWEGLTFLARVNRAAGRSIVAIGVEAAINTKRITHVETGNLRRSTHAAPPSADHADDGDAAASGDMLLGGGTIEAEETIDGPAVEVGSWLPYAYTEWITREHPGVREGVDMTRGAKTDAIVRLAFQEEGLSGLGKRG